MLCYWLLSLVVFAYLIVMYNIPGIQDRAVDRYSDYLAYGDDWLLQPFVDIKFVHDGNCPERYQPLFVWWWEGTDPSCAKKKLKNARTGY